MVLRKNIRGKYILIFSIITIFLLNVLLRFPTTNHQIGCDSYRNTRTAQSIIKYGEIKWFVNILSLYGYYPYSYPTGAIVILSEHSLLSSLSADLSVLCISIIEGVFAFFFMFLFVQKSFKNKLLAVIAGFIYSTSPGMLYFTTWTFSTRGMLLILYPLLLLLMWMSVQNKNVKLYTIFFIFLFTFVSVHKAWIFIFIFIIIFYIIYFRDKIMFSIKKRQIFNYSFIMLISIMIFLIINSDIFSNMIKIFNDPFTINDIYDINSYRFMLLKYGKDIGFSGIFIIFGLLFYIKNINRDPYFVVLSGMILLVPTIYIVTYSSLIILFVFTLVSSAGVIFLINNIKKKKQKSYVLIFFAIFIAGVLSFSAITQVWHPGIIRGERIDMKVDIPRSISPGALGGAFWLKYTNPKENLGFVFNEELTAHRILTFCDGYAINDRFQFELINGFVDKNFEIEPNPIIEWPDKGPFSSKLAPTAYKVYGALRYMSVNNPRCKEIIVRYNLSYAVENNYYHGMQGFYPPNMYYSEFFDTLPQYCYVVYKNSRLSVYFIDTSK